ncbi:hypothetical protein SLEP1_g16291 [Rubroshorea leprosula]|uniref:Nucleoporin autopeptidase n=1 Tax=Rubroshorea leprosula TaxID=152421 RepID=A0AAV5IY11_9ROSI|nr:hypothetical protein SLEP1_g16291 [Rubroshorea leprosula]
MFGSTNPFGQSSSSPFGSQSVFGQTSASNNPFAPKPFGSTTPFGAQTGGSIFGGTSTGVFGAQTSLPFSTTAFGASSSPVFGSSTPPFGASSTPTFGSSSSFGASSGFGQKPGFGFGSSTSQSPFGSSTQQTQAAFGGSIFGSSTPFGSSSQSAFGSSTPAFGATTTPAFGATSTPAFGATSTPAFGATSTPAFGATSTPAFGAPGTPAFGATSTPAFGSTGSPAFGSTGTAFGVSNAPIFGSGGAFGASTSSVFGSSTTPSFGASSTPAFGASSTPAFGASSTPSFGFGSSPAFGQSTSAFGSSPFGTTTFGAQSSPFGAQSSTPAFGSTSFGQAPFGGQRGGSRVTPYMPTTEADGGSGAQPAGKLDSISAMPAYKDKSHEELRWEDYQLGDKGGPQPAQSTGGIGFGGSTTQTSPFAPSPTPTPTPAFGQTPANPFSTTTPSNPFAPKTPTFGNTGFGTSTTTANPFGTTSTNLFGTTSSTSPSLFTSTSSAPFGTGSSLFGSSTAPSFGSSPSLFSSAPAQATTPTFGTGLNFGSQTSPLFNSTTPSIGQTSSNPVFGQNTTSFGQTSIFNTPSTAFSGNLFSNSSSLVPPSNQGGFGQATPIFSSSFQPAQPAQATSSFGFSNFGQTQTGVTSSVFGQNAFGHLSATQSAAVVQPVTIKNPFGALPAMPQISIGRAGTAPSVQYGISSMPVIDKPAPVRVSTLLTSRHLSQRRIRLPARKYHPNNDSRKVPFFSDDEETPSTPKADAVFIPRENPRALVIRPTEHWPSRAFADKISPMKNLSTPVQETGKRTSNVSIGGLNAEDKDKNPVQNGSPEERVHPVKVSQKPNGVQNDHSLQRDDTYKTLSGHRAGEAAIVYEHGADIEALMPKLRRSDYYTEPRIQELAAKERGDPGYCRHVKDFVVGRHGFGSIKFLGETDVRRLDLESLIQFNNREVIVYMDDSKKPPVGQGLNKPAVVTLLNIKCFDKKTGRQYTEGPKAEKYKEMLKRKTEDQGAEFVSYDPVKGEWKFRVNHFSRYKLVDEEDDDTETYSSSSR